MVYLCWIENETILSLVCACVCEIVLVLLRAYGCVSMCLCLQQPWTTWPRTWACPPRDAWSWGTTPLSWACCRWKRARPTEDLHTPSKHYQQPHIHTQRCLHTPTIHTHTRARVDTYIPSYPDAHTHSHSLRHTNTDEQTHTLAHMLTVVGGLKLTLW